MFDLEKLSDETKLLEKANKVNSQDEIAKKATTFARYAMADVEYGMAVLGLSMSKDDYSRVFKAMMIRKAKNEVRKYNAS